MQAARWLEAVTDFTFATLSTRFWLLQKSSSRTINLQSSFFHRRFLPRRVLGADDEEEGEKNKSLGTWLEAGGRVEHYMH